MAALLILLRSFLLNIEVSHSISMSLLQIFLLTSEIIQSVPLTHGLFGEFLVLSVNVTLDLLDVTFSMHESGALVIFKFQSQLLLLILSHFGHTDVDAVLLLINSLFNTFTVLLHQQKTTLELDSFLALFIHFGKDLIELFNLGVDVLLLIIGSFFDLILLCFVVLNGLGGNFLSLLLEHLNLCLQLNHFLHGSVILFGQPQNDVLLLFILVLHRILHTLHVSLEVQYLSIPLLDHLVQ